MRIERYSGGGARLCVDGDESEGAETERYWLRVLGTLNEAQGGCLWHKRYFEAMVGFTQPFFITPCDGRKLR
jgi:hypothetical protein